MLAIKFNQSDFNRIEKKLARLKDITSNLQSEANPIRQFQLKLLRNYGTSIVSVMGSVSAVDYSTGATGYSGRVVVDFSSLGMRTITYWKNLHPSTIEKKKKEGWKLIIWESSGQTKRAIKLHEETGFVGIDKNDDAEAWLHAWRTETGADGEFEKRALFTIANNMFVASKDKIIKEIMRIILSYVEWGK